MPDNLTLTKKIGDRGEDLAAEWLETEGFEIVARNWRSGRYELDIVARRLGALHFIEVKTRHEEGWQSSEDALDPAKRRAFNRAASLWLAENPSHSEPQLDLIAVDSASGEVRYIPFAVLPRW